MDTRPVWKIRKLTNAPDSVLKCPQLKDSDKTLGFSSGGDDYLAKPFSYPELISRVKALIRRYQIYKGKDEETITEVPSHIHYHNLDIDRNTETVYRDGEAVRSYQHRICHAAYTGYPSWSDLFCRAAVRSCLE